MDEEERISVAEGPGPQDLAQRVAQALTRERVPRCTAKRDTKVPAPKRRKAKAPRPSTARPSSCPRRPKAAAARHRDAWWGSSLQEAHGIYGTPQARTSNLEKEAYDFEVNETILATEQLKEIWRAYGYELKDGAFRPGCRPPLDLGVPAGLVSFTEHKRFHVIPKLEAPFHRGTRDTRSAVHKPLV